MLALAQLLALPVAQPDTVTLGEAVRGLLRLWLGEPELLPLKALLALRLPLLLSQPEVVRDTTELLLREGLPE
jgi:hypothetical protein